MTLTADEQRHWIRAYLASLGVGMTQAAAECADNMIAALRGRQGAMEIDPPVSLLTCGLCHSQHLDLRCPSLIASRPSPSDAREKLGAWGITGSYSYRPRFSGIGWRMCAGADGSWKVYADDGCKLIAFGLATLGTFPTLLAAAQHAADTSPEARERYTWEGKETFTDAARKKLWEADHIAGADKMIVPTREESAELKAVVELFALYSAEMDNLTGGSFTPAIIHKMGDEHPGFAISRRVRGIPDPTPDFVSFPDFADAADLMNDPTAPTRAEVEAARAKWDAVSRPVDFYTWLGWTENEAYNYEYHGTIPARPLRTHEAAPVPPRVYTDEFLDECARWANEKTGQKAGSHDREFARDVLTRQCCPNESSWNNAVRERAAQLDAEAKPRDELRAADELVRLRAIAEWWKHTATCAKCYTTPRLGIHMNKDCAVGMAIGSALLASVSK